MTKKVLFFVPVKNRKLLNSVGFYRADISAFAAAGWEVSVATRWRELFQPCDLFFIWWWGRTLPAAVAGRVRAKPVLVTGVMNFDTGDPLLTDYDRKPRVIRWAIRMTGRVATLNLFCSRQEYEKVPEALGLPRSAHFPCAVSLYREPSESAVCRTADDAFVLNIAWSGRENLVRKCVFELIDGFETLASKFPSLRLVLAGNEGDGADELRAKVAGSNSVDRIDLLGQVNEVEKARLLRQCSVYASPSRYEGFGLAIAEAATTGRPVVSSRVGELAYLLGEDGARFCDGSSPREIASAIDWCLSNPAEARAMARKAQRSVERFTPERKVQQLQQILTALGCRS